MTLKERLRYSICEFGQIPRVARLVRKPALQRVLSFVPGTKALYWGAWDRLHPFDRLHGIHTSGSDQIDRTLKSQPAFAQAHSYAGSQPSIIRAVLSLLPGIERSTFVDLGCGKGRPLFVASEFPFRA